MNPLNEEIEYKSEEEFNKLVSAIQEEIDAGNLSKYVDRTWRKERRSDWNGEYISVPNRRMYRFDGNHYHSTKGEPRFEGKWIVMRDEEQIDGRKIIYRSQYQIRAQEPGVFAKLDFEIEFDLGEAIRIEFEWVDILNDGKNHSRLITSTVEYGIISAFEDLNPEKGCYKIKLLLVRYHLIDSSFSLLSYAANRNLKRALFAEHDDENPRIESGYQIRKFRPNFTIGRLNNK